MPGLRAPNTATMNRAARALTACALALACAGCACAAKQPAPTPGASSQATGTVSSTTTPSGGAGSTATTESAVTSAAPAPARMSARDFDALIATEYPGYLVRKRTRASDQWGKGVDGMNYLLASERFPGFLVFVSLAQPPPGASPADGAPDGLVGSVRGVWTNDTVFSADAKRRTPYLQAKGQDALIAALAEKFAGRNAIVYGGFGDEGELDFMVMSGTEALRRAVRDPQSPDFVAVASIPRGPQRQTTHVTVQRW